MTLDGHRRHYYRCLDCLAVRATLMPAPNTARCECGGKLEYLGRVSRNNLVLSAEQCPCDYRCTHAIGPHCSCSCGGVNHGSGRTVTVDYDAGPIPLLRGANLQAADEYRAALAAAMQRVNAMPGAAELRRGEYIARPLWQAIIDTRSAINAAKRRKTHTARLRALSAIASGTNNAQ